VYTWGRILRHWPLGVANTHFLQPDIGRWASACDRPISAIAANNQQRNRQQHDSSARIGSNVNVISAIWSQHHKQHSTTHSTTSTITPRYFWMICSKRWWADGSVRWWLDNGPAEQLTTVTLAGFTFWLSLSLSQFTEQNMKLNAKVRTQTSSKNHCHVC